MLFVNYNGGLENIIKTFLLLYRFKLPILFYDILSNYLLNFKEGSGNCVISVKSTYLCALCTKMTVKNLLYRNNMARLGLLKFIATYLKRL